MQDDQLPEIQLSVVARGWPKIGKLRQLAAAAVGAALDESDTLVPRGSEVSLLFADDATIRILNRKWRSRDSATNVLSFPGGMGVAGAPAMLGDIVLALETVRREADLEGKSIEHHVSHLMIHGFLHLLGYDHEKDDDAEKMEAVERSALTKLGIEDPYR